MGTTTLEQCGETFKQKTIKFLVILMDSKINWAHQIDKVCNKLRSVIHLLSQVKNSIPISTRILLLKGLFMPQLEYGLAIYGKGGLDKVLKLQKWAIRTTYKVKKSAHTTELFKHANILKVDDLYKANIIAYVRSTRNPASPYMLRNMLEYNEEKNRRPHYFTQNFPYNKLADSLPKYTYARIWNECKFTELEDSTKIFKKAVKKDLVSNYVEKCNTRNCYSCKQQELIIVKT